MPRVVALAFLVLAFVAGCGGSSDSYHDLEIGDTKKLVLQKLVRLNIRNVIPYRDTRRVNYSNVGDLTPLPRDQSLRVGDSQRLDVRYQFSPDDRVTKVTEVGVESSNRIGIRVGMSRQDVIERLSAAMAEDRTIFSTNFDENVKWVDPVDQSSASASYLEAYDTWIFSEANSHSDGKLTFEGDRLVSIAFVERNSEPW